MMKYLKIVAALLLLVALPAGAEGISLDFGAGGGGGSVASNLFHTMMFLTVLSIAPSILMMVTSFTRIIVVFSFLRTALGMQQSPPNMVLASLALFISFFVMYPTFETAYQEGVAPYIEEKISGDEAWEKTTAPFRDFMMRQVRPKDLSLFKELAGKKILDEKNVSLQILVPAFMISELRRAFEIGFLLFIPFLVIDMVVASILMAMGMMMLPPVSISLPFKVIFFVLIDGWYMLSGSLMRSFEAAPG